MIQLTEKAKEQVKRLIKEENRLGVFLRVGVKAGGCSGMNYDVKFDDKMDAGDRIFEMEGLMLVCDPKSLLYVDGMTIDYTTGLVGAGFKFINPKATDTCGCGTSFTV